MKNNNEVSFLSWWLMRNDHLSEIAFFFKSKKNAKNERFYPLYEKYKNVRIIHLNGVPIRYFDFIYWRVFKSLIQISKRKIQNYETLHSFNLSEQFEVKKIILHIDDPQYTDFERDKLLKWEMFYSKTGTNMFVICTNNLTRIYLENLFQTAKVYIVEQGFHQRELVDNSELHKRFVCAYSSAYIDYGNDKHANHSTWGASVLIDEIIPNVSRADKNINFLIIGRVGKHARKALQKYPNVHSVGLVNPEKNIEFLSKCSLGIYPRKFDHNRSVLKIYTYIGAGLPIVTFDLNDTEIVKSQEIGYSVKTSEEFVEKILLLNESPRQLKIFRERIMLLRLKYTWQNLATKLEKIVNNSNF